MASFASVHHHVWRTQEEEREKERLNDGNNNGQATHGARKHAWTNCFNVLMKVFNFS